MNTPQTVAAPEPLREDLDAALRVRGLDIRSDTTDLVNDVSFDLRPGERVALIGESGSGKSLTSLSLLGLLPPELTATGSVELAGVGELLGLPEKRIARLRGNRISMVFQEPMTALNPTKRVGKQVAEVFRLHDKKITRKDADTRAVAMLEEVELPDPRRAADAYPHQLSGGQRQRVVLAIAMANRPSVLVCDEPTTALDVTVQARILDLINQEVERQNAALLFITHDLAVVSGLCDRVLVMYGGRIVEHGAIAEVFQRPRHPYTLGLLNSSDLTTTDADGQLPTIPGSVPPAGRFPQGCVFRSRCDNATAKCAERPPMAPGEHGFACWHPNLPESEAS
jgi:peptide/nickel transport system ATP-binding protein